MIGEVIKEIRTKLGLSQREMAEILKVTQTALSHWEHNRREPDFETLNVLSHMSGISINKMLNSQTNEKHFSYAQTYIDAVDNSGEGYYAVKMKGDSMNKLRICDGDTLIIKAQDTVMNRDIALVRVDDEKPQIREYYMDGSTVTLTPHSTNRNHKMKFYNSKKRNIKILGKVISNIIKF